MISKLPFEFDFKKPDYVKVFKWRAERLDKIRKNPNILPYIKEYYRENPVQFIIDWGCTLDPKNANKRLPSTVPFLLFPKQIEWAENVLRLWHLEKDGITEKTRQMGMSWLSAALSASICLFTPGVSIGFGSRTEAAVDKIGDPKSIFQKIRLFLNSVPVEFRGGWIEKKHSAYLKIIFPETNCIISGEGGKNIGRGSTTSLRFIDEAAHLEQPYLVEAALAEGSACRIDISTPRGRDNPFAEKRFSGAYDVFRYHWRDDPRKDQAWYDQRCAQLIDPVIIAQELDIDYDASKEGVLIPSAWVQSAIDAHIKLNITPTGKRVLGLDIADEGQDTNAAAGVWGVLLEFLDSWSGQGGDIFKTVQKAVAIVDNGGYATVAYDADGLGAGVRGDIRVINDERAKERKTAVSFTPFKGSESPISPESRLRLGLMTLEHKNKDFFANRKAQAWWALRMRFLITHRAITENQKYDPDSIISISSGIKKLDKLTMELSQPTFSLNLAGKILIDKQPDGTSSPNLADAVMIATAPQKWRGF